MSVSRAGYRARRKAGGSGIQSACTSTTSAPDAKRVAAQVAAATDGALKSTPTTIRSSGIDGLRLLASDGADAAARCRRRWKAEAKAGWWERVGETATRPFAFSACPPGPGGR